VYLLLGVLLALLLDWYINPGDPSEKKDLVQALALIMAGVAGAIGVYFTWRVQRQTQEEQELEAVRVKLEDPCVLGDGALNIFGSTLGLLGLYLH
jgi:hypothetical protein